MPLRGSVVATGEGADSDQEAQMNETLVTVAGNVAGEPRMRVTAGGVRVASFRLASTERRYNKELGAWRDGDTVYYTVTCWRTMAENAFESVQKGHPVVVHGRLHVGSYEKEGQERTVVEIEARSLGHDLSWGVSRFTKARPGASSDRQLAGELASELDDEQPFDPETGELIEADPGRDAAAPPTEDAA
jgi:single-strand DNA-binding protein